MAVAAGTVTGGGRSARDYGRASFYSRSSRSCSACAEKGAQLLHQAKDLSRNRELHESGRSHSYCSATEVREVLRATRERVATTFFVVFTYTGRVGMLFALVNSPRWRRTAQI